MTRATSEARALLVTTLLISMAAPGRVASQKPPRVLYVTHSAGFRHSVLPLSEEILPRIGRGSGFDVTLAPDAGVLTADSLRDYAAVIFYTTGELPLDDVRKEALIRFVREGGGFVGVHSATDTFYQWPAYLQLVGGYFDGHPWHQEVTIRVEDRRHPATAHLPERFVIRDEIYQFRDWSRDRVHVLLSLDTASVDARKAGVKRADGDFALAWTRELGRGRVFYTALGHEPDVWRDPRFQQHLAGGIRWAMRR